MKISLMALVAGFCLVVGLPLVATAGPTPGSGVDLDDGGTGDGIEDPFDNCTNDPGSPYENNPGQIDFDADGCGNLCDADYNNDGAVAGGDFILFKNTFLTSKAGNAPGTLPGQYNGNADSDGDDLIAGADFIFFKNRFLGVPGPSGFPALQKAGVPACP